MTRGDHDAHSNRLYDNPGRRDYLKGAAATAAAATGVAGTGAAATTVPRDADLSTYVSNHQGETIYVPDETYNETDTIYVGSGTTLIFQGTTIDPGTGTRKLFRCDGSNWHVGGDCTIIQQQKNFVWIQLLGAGQFGDTDGRITVDGYADAGLIKGSNETSTIYFGRGSGHIEVVNFTHPGAPPGSSVSNRITWTDRSGDITMRGCDIRNVGSNGFYIKTMTGRFEAYDCYFKNINVSVARTGADGGTLFKRCCVVYDDGLPYQDWSGGRYGSMVALQDGNDVVGDIEIRNCDYVEYANVAIFVRDMATNDGASIPSGGYTLHISDTQWTGYPDNRDTASYINYDFQGGNGGDPVDSNGPYPDGSGGSTQEVAEDFSHNDVPGTYSLDTGSFTTTSTRSTTDSYSLQPAASSDGGTVILRDDMVTTAGDTYELDVYHQSSSSTDTGIVFGAQSTTSWSDYTGYMALLESDDDQIALQRWENGSLSTEVTTATTWPLDEWLTVRLDYRDSDASAITMTLLDAAGTEVATTSLADTAYDGGTVGWFNWHAASDWFADSWFNAGNTTLLEGFGHNDVSGTYTLDTGSFTTTSTRATTDSYSLQPAASTDGSQIVLRDDVTTAVGNTYEFDVYHQSSSSTDTGFLFGAQSTTSWSDYTGYMALLESDDDQIALQRWENGSLSTEVTTATTWPLDEWLTVRLDYRDSDASAITMTLLDAAGTEVATTSLTDTAYDSGATGWFNWHAASDWFADSLYDA
jgi:hypothetical protein